MRHVGQQSECSRHVRRHVLQNEWPHGSVAGWCMNLRQMEQSKAAMMVRIRPHAAQLSGTLAPRQAPAQREYLAELYARAAQDGGPPSA